MKDISTGFVEKEGQDGTTISEEGAWLLGFTDDILPDYVDVSLGSASIKDLEKGITVRNPYTGERYRMHSVFMRFMKPINSKFQ